MLILKGEGYAIAKVDFVNNIYMEGMIKHSHMLPAVIKKIHEAKVNYIRYLG